MVLMEQVEYMLWWYKKIHC